MDGFEIIPLAILDFHCVIFVMVTAETPKDNIVEAVKAGVNNYVVKSFTAETIAEKLQKVFKCNILMIIF